MNETTEEVKMKPSRSLSRYMAELARRGNAKRKGAEAKTIAQKGWETRRRKAAEREAAKNANL